MFNVELIYSKVIGTDEYFFEPDSNGNCEKVTLDSELYIEETSKRFEENINCNGSYESSKACLITNTDNMYFSGVEYDSDYYPTWYLEINGENYSSKIYRLVKLRVGKDVIYDITRHDLRYWYKNNKKDRKRLCNYMANNNCNSSDFIEGFSKSMELPCSRQLLYEFLVKMNSLD